MITLSEKTKRLLFIGFFILFSIAIGYALYYFFFRPLAPTPTEAPAAGLTGNLAGAGKRGPVTPTQPSGAGGLTTAGGAVTTPTTAVTNAPTPPSDVTLVRDAITQAVSPDTSGNMRFYNPDDGRFYRINPDGSTTALSNQQFYNVQKVDWGNTSDEAILEFPDETKIYYSFEDQRQVTLPSHWSDFEFSPNDSKVVAKSMGLDENNRFLMTADPNGNGATALYNLGDNADLVIPSWSPSNQVIGFSKTGQPQGDNGEEIYLLGPNHENYQALTVPGRGFVPSWSPSGKMLLYSVYHERDGNRPMLWVSDAQGQDIGANRQKLNLNTWADLCAWANDNEVYCAVPVDLPEGAGFSKDTFSQVPDDVYYINLKTGMSKKVNTADQNHPISKPILTKDNKLMFTDAVSGKLYSYTLQ